MKITITTNIGTEGCFCWCCNYAPSFSWCELFRKRLLRLSGETLFTRCPECQAADSENLKEKKHVS